MVSALSHIKEIERVAMGGASDRDRPVIQSWLRCLNDYQLNPAQTQQAYIVPDTLLREHREQSEELIRIGRSGLEALFRQVADQNYVLLLSDARGVTVEFMGDPTFDNQLRKAGLYLGSEWSEDRAGTCAVGACMVSGKPVIIHQDDHFDACHIGLTCTAAPIFDTFGDLSAVLDISQLRSPTAKASQQLALHLVASTARRIELANLMTRAGEDWVLRLAKLPDFLDVDPDAALTVNGNGIITGLTHGGFGAVARAMGRPDLATRQFIGKPISDVFDIEIEQFPTLMRGRPNGERLLEARNGLTLFASAIAPVSSFRTSTPSQATRLPAALRQLSFGDPAMEALQARAARLADRHLPILIRGETGSGKEYLARAIHDSSAKPGPFIAVNCAAIPEQLIESELFGYVAGAFTGATQKGKIGLIEAANGGTLFLDEIGDMPLVLQSRLLRVLSESEIQPVGALKPKPVKFRLLSASHHDLAVLAAQGRFREDLLYRLNAATLTLPALRNRQDFDSLVDHLLRRIGDEEGEKLTIDRSAKAKLAVYRWPGNLRELDNTLRVAAAMAASQIITTDCLPDHLQPDIFENNDQPTLRSQLDACGNNISALARKLGVNRSTIHRRLKQSQI
ncbi:sigma-54-dependent Fis family transcriptional regulator [Brucella pseudogrignonensis]|jgi:transcriptional regulator of acetoin/glycerol metabolism|uniref:Sigma-54-dependent Fis family transcriptional regulator n=1 Tax=Brucella pseudogrignonensis TaxID=419475 RepID=A0A7Y3TDC2_9HYPH|nr:MULTISPECIES: sigma-54-dependent Fis family transcriptional regulator [Brucella]MBK0022770.1 sigma-54-dependent Fis family transcriptional regulator [Ochrobactrum sp. S45]MBK0044785.1 sigma-54-dependent Fis family transcriptional regulator [Ochrobactrum sp. S46]KAB2689422.1 sigma-54-dependent Fis family transcriptional regulator [Brucella pseudogrignonensis]MCD4512301.1 sigma-54-dependent Fis family transcriptional regulator [Brucella pseudogrignonensis]NNV23597.1 sigma-54-dependent Fis fam